MAPRKSSSSSVKEKEKTKDKDKDKDSKAAKSDEIKKYVNKAKETFYEHFNHTADEILRMKSSTAGFSAGKLDDQRSFMNKNFKEKVNSLEKITEKSKDAEIEFTSTLKTLSQSIKEINDIKTKEKSLDTFVINLEKELIQDLKKYKSSTS